MTFPRLLILIFIREINRNLIKGILLIVNNKEEKKKVEY